MRDVCLALTVLAAALTGAVTTPVRAQPPQPSSQQPVFRAGVELLTMDVTAVDGEGRQVKDLTAADLAVEVDGQPRQVVTAEYVALVDPRRPVMTLAERQRAAQAAQATRADPYVSTNNQGAPPGRLILLLIDQGNIRAGGGRQVIESARRFVDGLQPEDRVALAAVPAPGEAVDFTTDHDAVKEALARVHGTARSPNRRFNLSMTEAIALYQNNDVKMAFDVVQRECGLGLSALELERCEREVEQEAAQTIAEMRQQAGDSIRSMRDLFRALGAIEGAKQVILVSEGLYLEHLTGDVDELAGIAADSRASLDILMLDIVPFDAALGQRPTTPREDRRLQEEGLDALAGLARGTVYRVTSNPRFAFERIGQAIEGYYLLGVEARPADKDGRRHRLSVKTTRRGVTLRSRRSFLTGVSGAAASPAEAVTKALRSPLPANDLPMRLAAWTFKETGSTRVRVLVAVEVERLSDQALDYTTGFAIIDRNGRARAPDVTSTRLERGPDPAVATYATTVVVDPGSYRVRVAMADSEGRVGSVDRAFDAFHVDGASLALGDLLLGTLQPGTTTISPRVEPVARGDALAAMLEAYLPAGTGLAGLSGSLEVLRDEQSAPITTIPMSVVAGRGADTAAAQAAIATAALPPGRYLARATLRQDGAARGHLVRPFRVEAGTGTAANAGGMPATLPIEFARALVAALPAFDRRDLLSPTVLGSAFTVAESRGKAAAAAIGEARGGKLGPAAMTALTDGDQTVAAFLRGLDLLSQGQNDRAAIQFQNAMQQAPQFAPARVYLGVTLATGDRHREAAGLLQSGATPQMPAVLGRAAGEEWLRAGEPGLAVTPLEQAAARPDADPRTARALGIAYVLANRAPDAVSGLGTYLATAPADRAALLAGIYALYARHAAGPQAATLAADRALAQTWLKAYGASDPQLTPLVTAWVRYLEEIR